MRGLVVFSSREAPVTSHQNLPSRHLIRGSDLGTCISSYGSCNTLILIIFQSHHSHWAVLVVQVIKVFQVLKVFQLFQVIYVVRLVGVIRVVGWSWWSIWSRWFM